MTRTTLPKTPVAPAADFGALAAEWQRLATSAWSDLGRQAETGRTEMAEAPAPAQAWLLQMELLAAQATRMTRLLGEAYTAALDLQTRWFQQFEAFGLAGAVPAGTFGAWDDWQRQMLSALRHDVEVARGKG